MMGVCVPGWRLCEWKPTSLWATLGVPCGSCAWAGKQANKRYRSSMVMPSPLSPNACHTWIYSLSRPGFYCQFNLLHEGCRKLQRAAFCAAASLLTSTHVQNMVCHNAWLAPRCTSHMTMTIDDTLLRPRIAQPMFTCLYCMLPEWNGHIVMARSSHSVKGGHWTKCTVCNLQFAILSFLTCSYPDIINILRVLSLAHNLCPLAAPLPISRHGPEVDGGGERDEGALGDADEGHGQQHTAIACR